MSFIKSCREVILCWYESNCGFNLNFKSLLLGLSISLLITIGTITINTFSPKRNKFVYSHSIKVYALGFDKLLESIFCILLVAEVLCVQKVIENMANEAKLRSSICSTCEALVVWHAVRRCYGEELGPFCWTMLAAAIAIFGASHWFAEHTSQM